MKLVCFKNTIPEIRNWALFYIGKGDESLAQKELQEFLHDRDRECIEYDHDHEEFFITGSIYGRPGIEDGTHVNWTSTIVKIEKVKVEGQRSKALLCLTKKGHHYILRLSKQIVSQIDTVNGTDVVYKW